MWCSLRYGSFVCIMQIVNAICKSYDQLARVITLYTSHVMRKNSKNGCLVNKSKPTPYS